MRWLLYWLTSPLRALLSTPGRLFRPLRKVAEISLPARVAWMMAVFLVICVVAAFVTFYYTPNRAAWNYWMAPARVTLVVLLVILIPWVVYQTLRLWLEGGASPFPDIDRAWKAGLAELRRQGLELKEIPVFLVIGVDSAAGEKALFDASRLELNLREVPNGPAPIHWYANAEAIYVTCPDTSCLSVLARELRSVRQVQALAPAAAGRAGGGELFRGTLVGNIIPQQTPASPTAATATMPAVAAAANDSAGPRGTMMLGARTMMPDNISLVAAAAEKHVVRLDAQEAAVQQRRLQHLCTLIRRARQPLSPLNGVLALLPWEGLNRSTPDANELQRAVKRDLAVLRESLEVRCPATALVVGLEEESGFREFVRRVGRERAVQQRFGKGFTAGNPPTAERLAAAAVHACGAFEDWIYGLFREKGSLSKPGNVKLFALLCKIRRPVQDRLATVLSGGFALGEAAADDASMLFGGCYFAAVGETEDRQAFVKAVFEKLPSLQEDIEWTAAALVRDRRQQTLAQMILAFDTLLLLGIGAMVVYRWFRFW